MWEGLPDIESLGWEEATRAAVASLPWLADGISTEEQDAAREVALFAAHYGEVFRALTPRDWLNDGLHQAERDVLLALRDTAEVNEGVALHIAAMPFWITLEPWGDSTTLSELVRLSRAMPELFDSALRHQEWITDGLTRTERTLIALLDQFQNEDARIVALEKSTALLDKRSVQDGLGVVELELLGRVGAFQTTEAVEAAFDLIHAVLDDGWVQRNFQPFLDADQLSLIDSLMWPGDDDGNTGPILVLGKPWIADGLSRAESFLLTYPRWDLNDVNDVRHLDAIENVLAEPWVADGLNEVEMSLLAGRLETPNDAELHAIRDLVTVPWVADGLNETERSLFDLTRWWRSDEEAFATISELLDEPWVKDGLSPGERILIRELGQFRHDEVVEALSDAVIALSGEPWVADGLSGDELLIMRRIASFGTTESLVVARTVLSQPWVQDGLDKDERFVLEHFGGRFGDAGAISTISALLSEAWFTDGLDETERILLPYSGGVPSEEQLGAIRNLLNEPWVQDGMSAVEIALLWALGRLEDEGSAAALTNAITVLSSEPWAADGLDEDERLILNLLQVQATEGTIAERARAIETLFGRPWIQDGLNEDERFALSALGAGLTDAHIIRYVGALLKRPWAQDGLDEIERQVVSHIFSYGLEVPPLGVQREEKVAELPHTGTVRFTLILVSGGPRRDVDWLERNTRAVEELMGAPLPTDHVRLFLSPGPAAHFGGYIGVPAGIGSDWYEGAILHELGHYYWGSNLGWVNEGMASIIEDIIDEPRDGKPVDADNHPCARVRTIAELEQTDYYPCTYTLGKRIFLDLYRTVGYDAFRVGVNRLYSVLRGRHIDIDDLRASFKDAAPGHAEAIDAIIARWYDGTEPYVEPVLDEPLSDSDLPGLGLYIEGVDIAPVRGNPPVAVLPAKSVRERGPWLRLRLQVTQPLPGSQSELQVVGYYEDGFVFWRRDVRIPRNPQFHTEWIPFGPDPAYGVAQGRYWIEVYYQGQKVAEKAFRVT